MSQWAESSSPLACRELACEGADAGDEEGHPKLWWVVVATEGSRPCAGMWAGLVGLGI